MINIIELAEQQGQCRIDDNNYKNLAAEILFHLVADVYDGRDIPMMQILDDIERFKQRSIRHLSKFELIKKEVDFKINAMLKDYYNDQ
jgi:hypothetical protein